MQNPGPSYSFITQNLGNPGGGPGASSAGYGGGGAASAGGLSPGTGGGGGGAGYTWPVNTVTYGSGGNTNPQVWTSAAAGVAGAPGTGNGGVPGNMGPANSPSPTWHGGAGGGGACIIAVPTEKYPGSAPGSSSITTVGNKTVITYINTGSYNT